MIAKLLKYIVFFYLVFSVLLGKTQSIEWPKENQYVSDDIELVFSRSEGDYAFVAISKNADFSNIIIFDSTIVDSYIIPIQLENEEYYWKVGIRKNQMIEWNDSSSFFFHSPYNVDSLRLWLLPTDSLMRVDGDTLLAVKDNSNLDSLFLVDGKILHQKFNSRKILLCDGENVLELDSLIFENFHTFIMLIKPTATGGIVIGDRLEKNYAPWMQSMSTVYYRANVFKNFTGLSLNLNKWNIISFIRSNNDIRFFHDSIEQGSQNASFSEFVLTNIAGHGNLNNTYDFEGEIGEIILYEDSLTRQELLGSFCYLQDNFAPPAFIGTDIVKNNFCKDTLRSQYIESNQSFSWSTGETSEFIVVDSPGKYYLKSIDVFERESIDTIQVVYPGVYLFGDTMICQSSLLTWDTELNTSDFSFQWNTGSTDSLISIDTPGSYWVTVYDSYGCSMLSDTLTVLVDSFPLTASLGVDTSMCSGNRIGLEAGGNEAVTYNWNTSETTSEIEVNTTDIYAVTVTNNKNCIASDTIEVTIFGDAPNVLFSSDSVCIGDTTSLIDLSMPNDQSNVNQWLWVYETGDTSVAQNPIYAFPDSGFFSITLTVGTDSGCFQSYTDSVRIHPLPNASITVLNTLFCSEDSVGFEILNQFEVDESFWDFGDITSNSDTSILLADSYTYSQEGEYSVQLMVWSEYGCEYSTTEVVEMSKTPEPDMLISANCVGQDVVFQDNTPGANNSWIWTWQLSDGTSFIGDPVQYHQFAQADTFYVGVTVQNEVGCIGFKLDSLIVYDKPEAIISTKDFCYYTPIQLVDSSISLGSEIISWEWDLLNNEFESSLPNPLINFSENDFSNYSLKLKVTNSFGCTDSTIEDIAVHEQPVAQFSFNPEFGGAPLEVSFTNESQNAVGYTWYISGDTLVEESPNYTFETNEVHSMKLIAESVYGCMDTIADFIRVIPPVLDIAISNATVSVSDDNYMSVVADIANLGTRNVENFLIDAEIFNGTSIQEKWEGSLPYAGNLIYEFTTNFNLKDEDQPDVICITIKQPNNETDENLSNNQFCIDLNEFKVFEPYPNPANDVINLQFVIPKTDVVKVEIYNQTGRLVGEFYDNEISKGVNKLEIPLHGLNNDFYTIKVSYQDLVEVKKFIKVEEE